MRDLLSIGASGVKAYRSALATVSDNIANADTPGYSRRDIRLGEITAGAASPFYRGSATGSGVAANGITRAWDDFKAADARLSIADSGRATARLTWLAAAEDAMPGGNDSAGARITQFFGAVTKLAADASGWLPRQDVLNSLDRAAIAIRSDAQSLARVGTGIADQAAATVTKLNSDLTALAGVNALLVRASPGTAAQANLLDERDRLLDGIAGSIAIGVSTDARGVATVSVAGNSAALLVDGTSAGSVGAAVAADGTVSLSLTTSSTITIAATGGALAGLVDASVSIATQRAALDTIADDFATAVNDWNAGGRTAAGVAGGDLLAITGGAASLQLAATNPAAIAAASPDGTANGNLLDLSGLRGPSGAETQLSNMVLSRGSAINAAKAEASAAGTRKDTSLLARAATSGVDLDREAAELIRFQQSYDASARIIQVARETLQSILSIF